MRAFRKFKRYLRHNVPPPPVVRPSRIVAWIGARRRRKRAAIIWAILIVLGICAWLAWPPVSRQVKGWQARRLAKEANEAMAQEHWSEAAKKVQMATQLRPMEREVWKATARLLSRTGRGDLATGWWKKISESEPLSIEDRRDFAGAALAAKDVHAATEQIDFLLAQKSPPDAADTLLNSQLYAARGDSAGAKKWAERVITDPNARERQIIAGSAVVVATSAPGSPEKAAANERLLQISRGSETGTSLLALSALAEEFIAATKPKEGNKPTGESVALPISATELADRLDQHPQARASHKMLALELRARQSPEREEELIQQAVRKFGKGDDETVAALCRWLFNHRRYELVLKLLPADKASRTRELLLQRFDCLLELQRYQELKDALLTENPILDKAFQHMLLAVVRQKLGEDVASENEWERAVAEADNAQKLMTVGTYAERNRAFDAADAAYAKAIAREPEVRTPYVAELRMAEVLEDTAKAHDVAAEIAKRWPQDRENLIREIYLRLLVDDSAEGGEQAEKELKPILEANPTDSFARQTMALALLRQERGAAALDVLPQPKPADPPSAVLAAAWAANGWKDKAKQEATRLTTSRLLPEERALIAGIKL